MFTSELFDTQSKEGRLLAAAVTLLISEGPESMKGKDAPTVIAQLEQAAIALDTLNVT